MLAPHSSGAQAPSSLLLHVSQHAVSTSGTKMFLPAQPTALHPAGKGNEEKGMLSPFKDISWNCYWTCSGDRLARYINVDTWT